MHLIPTIPGGWTPNNEGVFHINQTPGDLLFLSAADTELHSLNQVYKSKVLNIEEGISTLPSLRLANLTYLKQELTIDTYMDEVVEKSKLVICRMLGGRSYYPYLFEQLCDRCGEKNIPLLLLPGYNVPDVELLNHSTVNPKIATIIWNYLCYAGKENHSNCLSFIFNQFFEKNFSTSPPVALPDLFVWDPVTGIVDSEETKLKDNSKPWVAILAYQSHYLADNLLPVQYLSLQIKKNNWNCLVVFINHLRDESTVAALETLLSSGGQRQIDVILNTTSFAIKSMQGDDTTPFIFSQLKAPVIQAIFASCTNQTWSDNLFGLTPTDIAINVALPEVDGRIITTAVSFKSVVEKDIVTDSETLRYETHEEGCDFVLDFCQKWINLRKKQNGQKRLALILPNYPNKDSRLANGVGLDTPESVVNILKALQNAGYLTSEHLPGSSKELMEMMTHYITNDVDTFYQRPYQVSISIKDFYKKYEKLSQELKNKIENQWGKPENSPNYHENSFVLPGFLLGNIFVSIQPARGYNQDAKSIYHSPDLPPTFAYLAYYFWITDVFLCDALIHVGKHGNLEWLPGKSVALSRDSCFPSALLGSMPHFYPFIVNDPGEGTQAKRRNQAVIIDHLIPPMTRAEIYGSLTQLEHLIDEYYEACHTDPKRSSIIKEQIGIKITEANLDTDLKKSLSDIDAALVELDGYLCELKESQIRDGLHVLGKAPLGNQLLDLLVALHRLPTFQTQGLTQVLAMDMGLSFDPVNCDLSANFNETFNNVYCRSLGDVVEQLEIIARQAMAETLQLSEIIYDEKSKLCKDLKPNSRNLIQHICSDTFSKIQRTSEEIDHLLSGLNGNYVPSGASGAPTRGNLHVLPTGKNFYSVDVRTIPTESAYKLGIRSANLILDRYLQEHGDYPETIGLSSWGTATMRTGGDDIAQAFALMGVKPIWHNANRRVVDFNVISLLDLKRPRVDVTLRISGFFRDAFPDVISLYNSVVERLAMLDEPLDHNPIRKRYLIEKKEWITKGLSKVQAQKRSLYRVFGSKPGAYGAGLQALLDEKNWSTREDLAKVYINWGGYAYGSDRKGESAHEIFEKRLSDIQLVMHNQDNREHDLLDSDDYYQFQGGMSNAIETMRGEQPSIYFGDHSRPENPKIKTLKEELLKVYRSRVINPKWMDGMKRHGYKGAFEMAATMDYLFAYDATTGLIDDFMYEGITNEYLINDDNRKFIEEVNPWALKDMTERMLEAIQRKMWKNPKQETLQFLESLLVNME